MSAMSRLENQKALVTIVAGSTKKDSGGGEVTGRLVDAFDTAMIKCSRRTFVRSPESEDSFL